MTCASTRDGAPCVRVTPHGPQDQHRSAAGRRWYYGDDMQRGMPLRFVQDRTPLITLVASELSPWPQPITPRVPCCPFCAGQLPPYPDPHLNRPSCGRPDHWERIAASGEWERDELSCPPADMVSPQTPQGR